MGCLGLDTVYVEGSKLESRANRYTFVWRKTAEKNKERLEANIEKILEQNDAGIEHDIQPDDKPPGPINSEELKKRIAEINREKLSKVENQEYIQKTEKSITFC
jgi:hypothetical protein